MNRREILTATIAATAGAACNHSSESGDESLDPIDRLTNLTRNLEPLPEEEYDRRWYRLRSVMREYGKVAFFVEAGSSLLYLTGVRWGRSERLFGAAFGKEGRPVFVSPAFEEERAREQFPTPYPLRTWEEDQNPFQIVGSILRDLGAVSGRIAVEASTRLFVLSGLARANPSLNFQDGSPIAETCRIVKSPRELRYLRLADTITKKAYTAALAGVWEGMTEQDLRQRVSRAHSRLGVTGGALVLFGPNSALPHGSPQVRHLAEGDVILMDGGCNVAGYRSDITRSVIYGEPSSLQKRIWDIVFSAQTAAFEAARPGVSCQELDDVARAIIIARGYGPDYQYFTHRLGHGIGLDGHEAPYLVRGNQRRLEPGMTFSNEPGIYLPGQWGMRHEDIMAITENGASFLGDRAEKMTI